jgi:reverse transcriptase-like protein
LLQPLALPAYLHGGVRGRSVRDNVLLHFGAEVLVTLDIKSFYPSITNRMVYRVWKSLLNCSPRISALLTQLTTFERRLPQGAPTSTTLANLVLHSVDEPIRRACEILGVKYSTLVDDLAFSGKEARHVINVAVDALWQSGLAVSHRKMKIMARGTSQVLNGVLMGRFPSVVPGRLSQIRSGIHKLEVHQVPPPELHAYVRSLEGRINHVGSIVPHKAQRLREDFEAAKKIAFRQAGTDRRCARPGVV